MGFVGINKLSLLDYPGKVCCILFTNKCNFYCPFCHNGLTLLPNEEEMFYEDILSFLKKRVGLLDGVTITGGEPTLLPDLEKVIKDIKALGFLVKLDTNGSNPKVIKNLLDQNLLDYIAMDVKNSLSMYPTTCGNECVNLDNIKESINLIQNSGVDYEFRTTIINEYHSLESIKEMSELLKGSKKLVLQKFMISDGVINKNLHPVDEDLLNKFLDLLKINITEVTTRGY